MLKINDENIEIKIKVTLLGIEKDCKLNFDGHVTNICQKASNQINTLGRIQNLLCQKEKETMITTFVYSNFNYAPLVWHFSSQKSQNKIEKIQERCLRILLNDFLSSYKTLLEKSGQPTMEVKRLRILAIEIYKTLNNLNPDFMRELFHYSPYATYKKHNLQVHHRRTVKFGNNSIKALGSHIWNSLPEYIKEMSSNSKFRELIKTWDGPQCKWYLCSKQLQKLHSLYASSLSFSRSLDFQII